MINYEIKTIAFASSYLKTTTEVIIALPSGFKITQAYDVYLVFDGKDLLLNHSANILANNNCVFIGLSSTNNMTRFNDLSTYTNYNVAKVMLKYFPQLKNSDHLGGNGLNYFHFISQELLVWFKNDYHLQIKTLNALGCSMGAYFCLQMLYLGDLTFTKMVLLSPAIWFNKQIFHDLTNKLLNNNHQLTIQLWVGKKEPKFFEGQILTNYLDHTLTLQTILTAKNYHLNLTIDDNGGHGFKWWIKFINENSLIFTI